MVGTFAHIVKNTGFTGLYSGVCVIPNTSQILDKDASD